MAFSDILVAIFPVFLLVGLGCLIYLSGFLNDTTEKRVMQLVLWVLYPCLILWKVPGSESLQDVSIVGSALGAGFLLTVVAMGVAWITGFSLKVDDAQGRNTFCVSAALQNYGFIPIPIIIALFGDSADETLGVLFVHNLGLEMAMWTLGLIILSGKPTQSLRRLINGPTLAITIGLFLNFSGVHEQIPSSANWIIEQLGKCSIPVSLVLVGAALASVVQREKWVTQWKIIWAAIGIRFAIMPLIFLGAAWMLSYSPNLQRVLIVEASMPAAIFPVVLAKHFGGKPSVAAQIIISTSLASVVLTPLILSLALQYFEINA